MELEVGKLGLQLNHAKSEIISNDHRAVTSLLEAVPDLCPVRPERATLLGSPTGGEEGVDKSISKKTEAFWGHVRQTPAPTHACRILPSATRFCTPQSSVHLENATLLPVLLPAEFRSPP